MIKHNHCNIGGVRMSQTNRGISKYLFRCLNSRPGSDQFALSPRSEDEGERRIKLSPYVGDFAVTCSDGATLDWPALHDGLSVVLSFGNQRLEGILEFVDAGEKCPRAA